MSDVMGEMAGRFAADNIKLVLSDDAKKVWMNGQYRMLKPIKTRADIKEYNKRFALYTGAAISNKEGAEADDEAVDRLYEFLMFTIEITEAELDEVELGEKNAIALLVSVINKGFRRMEQKPK